MARAALPLGAAPSSLAPHHSAFGLRPAASCYLPFYNKGKSNTGQPPRVGSAATSPWVVEPPATGHRHFLSLVTEILRPPPARPRPQPVCSVSVWRLFIQPIWLWGAPQGLTPAKPVFAQKLRNWRVFAQKLRSFGPAPPQNTPKVLFFGQNGSKMLCLGSFCVKICPTGKPCPCNRPV